MFAAGLRDGTFGDCGGNVLAFAQTSRTVWTGRVVAVAGAVLSLCLSSLWASGAIAAPAPEFGPPSGPSSSHVHEGVTTCGGGGSSCHGRQAATGLVVRQNELSTWSDRSSMAGRHSRAWRVLTEPRAEAIAARLGLGKAEAAQACLGCHSDHVPSVQRGSPYYNVSDGVGCEACHGGSGKAGEDEGWLTTHYGAATSHAQNVAHGLTPLDDPKVRAGVCLDCHFGSAKPGQFVSHRMMSAGHPAVAFELDLFSELQRHYDAPRRSADGTADLSRGRQSVGVVKTWAVGQAMALERALTLYGSSAGEDGAFPEFYFFDCQSCHRTLSKDRNARPKFELNSWRNLPSGMPPFNDENMILLSAASRTLDKDLAAHFDTDARAFHAGLAKDRTTAVAAARQLRATTSRLTASFATHNFSREETLTILNTVVSEALAPRYTDYAGGAQAVMAIETLVKGMTASGQMEASRAKALRPEIDRAYQAVDEPSKYDPAAFRSSLARISATLRGTR